ncbi:MAG: type II secretion system protein, partial [Candidatus Pacebacteria bacterium]|nr:type II secretion system protein [Candidatus Paceibacterota bacterium]
MNFDNKKGFTLIELLVVIAIIGILSGLIIVSMSGAQNSAKDAKIKAELDQMRATAELYKSSNDSYGSTTNDGVACDVASTFLATGSDGDKLCDDIQLQGSGALAVNIVTGSSGKYCIQKALNVSGSWCVDSTGYAGPLTGCDDTDCTCATGD